ncbi:ATPase WRNIP1-like [Chenopodium quinoa]|uniref:ATPase WRNIP1-like n=1 Tax=Chenopodium quinoa TaxID=63459 RepID=UPI000B79A055|nr:ATPase WRNIP1-like [Chenopodium quinoa]
MADNNKMENLLNMGFSEELAAQALAATGGDSTVKATEWLLSQPQSRLQTPPSQSISQPQQQSQLKLNKFFLSNSSKHPFTQAPETPQISPSQKRPKLSVTPSSSTPIDTKPSEPLSERMRPRFVDEIVGQDHILGPNSFLSSAVKCNRLPSIVLWGPPGTGKTSIAKALVNSCSCSYKFVSLSAVSSGVKDVREAVEGARRLRDKIGGGKRTVLFVDEVHRFNKSQQDSFLPVIEDGSIVFIGATTENPSFHLVTPLLSRCRVLTLNQLQCCDIEKLLNRAVDDLEKGLSLSVGRKVEVKHEAIELLGSQCDGDARVALNALEVCATTALGRVPGKVQSSGESEGRSCDLDDLVVVNVEDVKEVMQCKHLAYDKAGEEHYNLISALIKSMRGSDANAAIYWLARMLEGGEQPLYIARRLVVFASEDVGLADPNALLQAVACHQACHIIGMPECRLNLAQCIAYLSLAPKSVATYKALNEAMRVVKESVGGNEGVPLHLRNAPTKLMGDLGYGKGYIYTPENPTAPQSFLPPSLLGKKFLEWPPSDT